MAKAIRDSDPTPSISVAYAYYFDQIRLFLDSIMLTSPAITFAVSKN